MKTRARVAWMQQQFGPRGTRLENPIARDRAVTEKIAVEIVAHRGCKFAQLLGIAPGPPAAALRRSG